MYNNDYRKMRRKRIYIKLLIFWISLIVLVGGGYLFYRAHMVKNVTVTGNVHYTSEEIQDMVMTDELSHNSLYLSLVYKNKTIKDVPFIASMSVEVVAPDSIKIEVKEKNLAGYLKYVGQNVYFDDEGTVMEISGTYTAAVFVFSGTEDDFFHEGGRKAALFWRNAFREDAGRPTSLFGMPKISTAEFQGFLDEMMKEKADGSRAVKILTFSPWHAFRDGDGTYHWSQEAKVIITNEKGLSYPLWVYTSLYKEGNRYYLIEVNGSHEAADALGDSLVYGLYQLKRSSK